ncbi:enoyl-CoA hydratase/isomerase family protein [Algihabitans albus]|uniref:enoyl-CoA hydratase/isomerase family protein n=1 Tax=Algihabitans albus TaxID=2164067 RepID=UPI000E5D94D6|nr:enoyl-CoA hydratase-related protein [Algihabitans albus]
MPDTTMQLPPVLSERRGAIALLTLHDPTRRNALSLPMREALHDLLEQAMTDEAVRAIVITGAEGRFCAGGDLRSMENIAPTAARLRLRRAHRLVRLIVRGEKPVIAAIEGDAAGAGLSLAAACDLVLTSEDARFIAAFDRVGLMPDLGALWTVPARTGNSAARRLLLLGEVFDGREAARCGLADKAVAPGQALSEALAVAERLAAGAPLAIAAVKAMLARAPQALDAVLDSEADNQAVLFSSRDFAEGRRAFFEKQKPQFTGC